MYEKFMIQLDRKNHFFNLHKDGMLQSCRCPGSGIGLKTFESAVTGGV